MVGDDIENDGPQQKWHENIPPYKRTQTNRCSKYSLSQRGT